MLLSHRQTHFFAFAVLSVLLSLCFIAGIVLRPDYTIATSPETTSLFEEAGFVVNTEEEAIASTTLKSSSISLEAATQFDSRDRLVLILKPNSPILSPDLLMYWDETGSKPEELGDRALLLGSLAGTSRRQFILPDAIAENQGYLVLYSQTAQELLAAWEFPAELKP